MVFPKISLRNRTCFSEGEIPPEKMILSAIDAGAQTIGITVFADTSFSLSLKKSPEEMAAFCREIRELSEKYRDKITVLLGEERDFNADSAFLPCDYRVGFVHSLVADDGTICRLDHSAARILADVQAHFGGRMNRLIRRYFETVAQLVRQTRCDLIADFDFLQTFNAENRLFDPSLPGYRAAVLDAMEALCRENVAFEIRLREKPAKNGLRFSPEPDIVRWLAMHGARFFLSAPTASEKDLFAGFSECALLAKVCGAGGFSIFQNGEWRTIPIGREA